MNRLPWIFLLATLAACDDAAGTLGAGELTSAPTGLGTPDGAESEAEARAAATTFCSQMSFCSYITDTEAECVGMFRECIGDMRRSEIEDWALDMSWCVSLDSCDEIFDCWVGLPSC